MYHTKRTLLNDQWQFRWDSTAVWQDITLPHSWNALDTMNSNPAQHYKRGTGHYRRTLSVTADPTRERRQWLHFEAAAMKAQVHLNERLAGSHVGGYTPFVIEVTGFEPGQTVTLHTAVDNSPDPDLIPSDQSDFFLYGGLTRNVWQYETGPVRLDLLHIKTNSLTDDMAQLALRVDIDGPSDDTTTLQLALRDPQHTAVWETNYSLDNTTTWVDLPPIPHPQRWSPTEPHLYTLTAVVFVQGEPSDYVTERLGLRQFDFPVGGPFFLNGERLLLRGTHRHEDWAGYGAAVPDALSWREMRQIKAAGFNFIRLGHYPQADAVLDACDELGLLVWEELPWCRGGLGGETFQQQTRDMFREMVAHHYNRPSIIFWGLGNELDWESDHPDSTDEKVLDFLQTLHDLSHEWDNSRLTALRRFEPGADVVDVYSPSIWSGWYRGRYQDYERVVREAIDKYPRFFHAEWGGDSHVGRHNAGPHLRRAIGNHAEHDEKPGVALSESGEARASLDSDWSESYMLDVMEWHLQVQACLPRLAGTAQWVFKDFGTPLRPENPIPYVNQKGLVTRDGHPKDIYHLFQCYQTDTPTCYIESPTWPIRSGDPGALRRIRVYSNTERVELFVNGRSLGTKFPNKEVSPAGGLVWFVPLQIGENEIQAVGTTAVGQQITHTINQTLVPNGVVQSALLQGSYTTTTWQGQPAHLCTVQLATADNIPVTKDERRVCFGLRGTGKLLSQQGTAVGSDVIETANGRASILVLASGTDTVLTATVAGLPPLTLTLGEGK